MKTKVKTKVSIEISNSEINELINEIHTVQSGNTPILSKLTSELEKINL
jgi:hypothetical protein